jgi:hypothetical protein
MRPHEIVMAAVFVATCLSAACDRSSSDGAVTAPSPIATADSRLPAAATRPAVPIPPAPPTPPAPPGFTVSDRCDHTKAQRAIGQPASNDVLERARRAAGARTARFLRPNDVITMEFLASRLNVLLDAKHVVRSMYCG